MFWKEEMIDQRHTMTVLLRISYRTEFKSDSALVHRILRKKNEVQDL